MAVKDRYTGGAYRISLPKNLPASITLFIVALTVLGSYPLILKVFSPTTYTALLLAGFAGLVLTLSFRPRPKIYPHTLAALRTPWVFLCALLFGGHLLVLTVVSVLHIHEPYVPSALTSYYFKFLISAALFLLVPWPMILAALDRLSEFLAALAILSLLMAGLIAANFLPVLFDVQISTFGDRDSGIRQFYGLGFGWYNLHIADGLSIPRLQSFAAEAGNFAFALLVGILWAGHRKRWPLVAIMSVALLGTVSVGAAAVSLLLLLIYVFSRRAKRLWDIAPATSLNSKRLLAGISIVLVLVLLLPAVTTPLLSLTEKLSIFLSDRYLASKLDLDASTSSLGVRLESIDIVWQDIVLDNWTGLGAGGLAELDTSLAIGWVRSLIESGLIGWFFYLAASLILVSRALWAFSLKTGAEAALGAVVLALAAAAFQRAPIDATVWHLALIVAFVKSSTENRVRS